jgi:hypothetical protein
LTVLAHAAVSPAATAGPRRTLRWFLLRRIALHKGGELIAKVISADHRFQPLRPYRPEYWTKTAESLRLLRRRRTNARSGLSRCSAASSAMSSRESTHQCPRACHLQDAHIAINPVRYPFSVCSLGAHRAADLRSHFGHCDGRNTDAPAFACASRTSFSPGPANAPRAAKASPNIADIELQHRTRLPCGVKNIRKRI